MNSFEGFSEFDRKFQETPFPTLLENRGIMPPKLTSELQQALASQHGLVSTDDYVLMTKEVFCQMMGVGTDAEMLASLEAIQAGFDDVNSGRTVPMDQLFQELDRKYGVHH